MNDLLRQLFESIKASSAATKATYAGLFLGAIVVAVAAVKLSSRPHYELLHSEMSEGQLRSVGAALAEAGVDWQQSQPPGPFSIYVDKADMAAARNAMFLSGSMSAVEGGIVTGGSSIGSVFLSSGEREQLKRKREWEETEQMLERLTYIADAQVRTTVPTGLAFGREDETTGSVTLTVRPGADFGRQEARTVARMVRFALGIREENLIVSDQNSDTVYDGSDLGGPGGGEGEQWFELAEDKEKRLERKINDELELLYGPGLAKVLVRTEWDYDSAEIIVDSSDPKARAVVSEQTSSTETPKFPPSAGSIGAAGSSTNVVDAQTAVLEPDGTLNTTTGGATADNALVPAAEVATTSEKSAEYQPSRTLTHSKRRVPDMTRMTIALWLDSSIASQADEISKGVKSSVGFLEGRDAFEQAVFSRPTLEEGAEGLEGEDGEATGEPGVSPMLEMLLTRGVEIVSALAFIALLFVSLRGGKVKGGAAGGAGPDQGGSRSPGGANGASGANGANGHTGAAGEGGDGTGTGAVGGMPGVDGVMPEVDPELLAIRQVEELLSTDPERVGKILSSWAREKGMVRR